MSRTHTAMIAWSLALWCVLAPVRASAQRDSSDTSTRETAAYQLVRCRPARTAACLATRVELAPTSRVVPPANGSLVWRAMLGGVEMVGPEQRAASGATGGSLTPLFGAPVLPSTSLARTMLRGTLSLVSVDSGATSRIVASVPVLWRPPLIAMPLFVDVADSTSLPVAVREALASGEDPLGIRSIVALLLLTCGTLMVVFVPRFAWADVRETEEDLARQVAAARALLSTRELEELRGKAPREAKPRAPEDVTTESTTLPRPRK